MLSKARNVDELLLHLQEEELIDPSTNSLQSWKGPPPLECSHVHVLPH